MQPQVGPHLLRVCKANNTLALPDHYMMCSTLMHTWSFLLENQEIVEKQAS